MESKFDVIIFGASGCVGKHVVLEAIHVLEGLTWAIAGRSKEKLKNVLAKNSRKTTKNLSHIPIIIADANNPGSIERMVEKCDVLINCCGPYQLWAEQIINSCIITGTHYVDMCNDPYFNELMELRYHSLAMEYNVYVVSSCGFQSCPLEISLNSIRKQFEGTVNHVDAYALYNFDGCCLPICPLFTDTTWFSVNWAFALAGEISWLRKELREKPLPILMPKQPLRDIFHKRDLDDNSIFLRFPFTDLQFVQRSQYQLYAQEDERPIQFYKYVAFPSFFWAFIYLIWFIFLFMLSQFQITRKYIISYPRLFSMGVCSPDGPDEYTTQSSSYKIILIAEGWSKSIVAPSPGSLDRHMRFEICGFNPIYGCGCVCLLLASRCLVQERDKMPGSGGVYSPGYAFQKSNIFENLQLYPAYFSIQTL